MLGGVFIIVAVILLTIPEKEFKPGVLSMIFNLKHILRNKNRSLFLKRGLVFILNRLVNYVIFNLVKKND